MSSNISGFQGVKTPLQSMTNGQYTLADYTNLNRVLTARITALENASAFNPNNVTIGGFLNIQSNSTNPGNLSVTNNAQINGSLQVNKTVTINQNLNVAGNVVIAGSIGFTNATINTLNSTTITATTLNATTINNAGTITANSFSGNGSALTGVLDNTKLPLAGGTVSGAMGVGGNFNVNGTTTLANSLYINSPTAGNRSIFNTYYNMLSVDNAQNLGRFYLSGLSGSATLFANIYGQGVFTTNINGVNACAISDLTGAFNVPLYVNSGIIGNGSQLTNIPYSALTGTIPTWNQSTTGNAATATNVNYSGLTGTVPTWNQNTTGNAATATTVNYSGLIGTPPTWNQNTTGNAATATNVNYSGLTGTVPTWNQNTTGNAATATSVANITGGAAGKVLYQTGAGATNFTSVGIAGQILTSQGSAAPTWTSPQIVDNTKMPLAGGTFTGVVRAYQNNLQTNYDQILNGTYYLPADPTNGGSLWDQVSFNYNANCTLNLYNFTCAASNIYPDYSRKITITKKNMAAGDYVVTLNGLAPNYTFSTPYGIGLTSNTIIAGTFSHTYNVFWNTAQGAGTFTLISVVKI